MVLAPKIGYDYHKDFSMESILSTDGYKFSMAQAGFPLREETFYLSFRRGGWQYIPFDLEAKVQALLSDIRVSPTEDNFLKEHGYGLTPAMTEALKRRCTVRAVPERTWVYEREPILTVTGPSFLASWLEPMLLWLSFPIQLATAISEHQKEMPTEYLVAVCERHAEIIREVYEACMIGFNVTKCPEIHIERDAYFDRVCQRVAGLVRVVEDPNRLFEVGMRAATCMEHHRIALEACRENNVTKTSNVALAMLLGMKPVGTMGHEHVQRWGNDLDAFRAMRDMRPGVPSYLPDTFDTVRSGIPAAIRVMREQEHTASIRYDSGDKYAQYMYAHGVFSQAGLKPIHIMEDGFNLEMTRKCEHLRDFTGVAPERQLYGYGGYIVSKPMTNPLTRDRVSAVYKLTATAGEPRMKFADDSGLGKVSVPGDPVVWRYTLSQGGPVGVIAQAGEDVPENYVVLSDPESHHKLSFFNPKGSNYSRYTLSPETQRLVDQLREKSNART